MKLANVIANKKQEAAPFSVRVTTGDLAALISNALNEPGRRMRFIADLTSMFGLGSPALQRCDGRTIVAAALQAETLNLPINPALGYAYVVPFNDNANERAVATFIIGYKGLKQLALRTGQYKKFVCTDVKRGELVKRDRFTGEFIFNQIDNEVSRAAADAIGYYAMFEMANGYTKGLYMSVEEVRGHAARYSKAYQNAEKKGQDSKWHTDFNEMALKTVTRMLLLHDGLLTPEMSGAFSADGNALTVEDGSGALIPCGGGAIDGEVVGESDAGDAGGDGGNAGSGGNPFEAL